MSRWVPFFLPGLLSHLCFWKAELFLDTSSSWLLNSLPGVPPFLLSSLCYVHWVRDHCMYPSHMGQIYQHQVLMLPAPLLTAILGHATVYSVLLPHFCGFRIWLSGWLTWRLLMTERSHSSPITDVPDTPWYVTANLIQKLTRSRSPLFFHCFHEFPSLLLYPSFLLLCRSWK